MRARNRASTAISLPLSKIESWLDEETLHMMIEWSTARTETERKRLCLKWRLDNRMHPAYMFDPS